MKKILVGLWLAMMAFTASAQNNCAVSPDSCMTAPIAKACPTGKRWTTAGSGIAHCVNVDPVCASSEKVAYDSLGNPSCVSRCSASEYWDGSMCRPCTTTSTASGSCQSGYTGTAYRSVTTNSCTGSTSYGAWDYSGCTVSCTSSSSYQSGSCPSGYTGTAYRSVTTNSCSGTSYGSWDYSSCSPSAPTCGTSTSSESGSCQSGYSGSAYRSVTYNSCTGSTTYGSWNYSGCSPSAPSCGSSTSTESGSCQSGYTGSASRSVTYNSCTGSTTYGSWNYSGCTYAPVVTPPPACPDTLYQCGCEQAGVIIMTIYTTTYSGASCRASTTTQKYYVDSCDCPY
jgi:hypothetical protein